MNDVTPSALPAPCRTWATSSLVAGVVWLILVVSPTFLTTLLGLPFAGYAILVGWWSRRHSLRRGDRAGVRRAGWGMGLGCAGFIYSIIINLILGGLFVAMLGTVAKMMLHGTPTP